MNVQVSIDNGYGATYAYDLAGQLISVLDPVSAERGLSYSAAFQYDGLGNRTREIDAGGNATAFEYNDAGQLKTATVEGGGGGVLATNTYDLGGRLLTAADARGKTTSMAYTAFDTVYTTYTYDDLGRQLTETRGAKTSARTYDKDGKILTSKDWRGNTASCQYNNFGRLVKRINPSGVTIETLAYDPNGCQTSSKDALGKTTTFTYDRNRRQLSTADPLGHVTSVSYDNIGRAACRTDGNGNATQYVYNRFSQLIAAKDGAGTTLSSYTYDLAGNLLTQADGAGNTTTYTYNARNLAQTRADQGGLVESSSYNANGSLAQSIDRNGVAATYAYDIHGREISRSAGGKTIARTYEIGRASCRERVSVRV
jgi:YD repeat-containing protein